MDINYKHLLEVCGSNGVGISELQKAGFTREAIQSQTNKDTFTTIENNDWFK